MGRDMEYVWLGLARALESGVSAYQRRQEREHDRKHRESRYQDTLARQQAQAEGVETRFSRRQAGVAERHQERLEVQQERSQRATEKARRKAAGPQTVEEMIRAVSPGRQQLMMEDAAGMTMDPEAALRRLRQQQPTGKATEFDYEASLEESEKAHPGKIRLQQEFRESARETHKQKMQDQRGHRSDAQKVEAMLRQVIRQGPSQQPQQQQQGQGADGGMGMLDPQQFQQLPQGDQVSPQDQAQLGAMAQHFNTIMGLTPGATMTQIAQAYQWFSQNSQIAKLPMDVELFAQGVPGTQAPEGPSAMREMLG